ncbi:MAG: endonuclease III [Proteobacteria bacterium]|nr:endonuclease III [Pseudomonadota bacterium]
MSGQGNEECERVIMGLSAGSITFLLRDHFGKPTPPPRLPVLDELIKTILSQNTSDRNRDLAFDALKKRYPGWKDILASPPGELESVIAPAGLGATRGRTIRELLERAFADGGESFPDLEGVTREEGMRTLTSIRGVGPKTAACVLLFSCRIPAFPVDTHIHRVTRRLGLLPEGADRVKAQEVLEKYFPPDVYLEAHLNLIRLGREICRSRKTQCVSCPLQGVCRTGVFSKRGEK